MAKPEKIHTTNCPSTFISVAEDCPVMVAEVPAERAGSPTAARMQYDLISQHAYRYTSDDVLFSVHATKNGIDAKDLAAGREQFFSKGQPCFRASPLSKRYGWGVHSDAEGRIALYAVESEAYKQLAADPQLIQLKAMRSSRAK